MAKQDTQQKPESQYDAHARSLGGSEDSRFARRSSNNGISNAAKVADGGSKADKQAGESVGSDWNKSNTPENTGYNQA